MKMIEEFKVSGKFGNNPINGKVTTYFNNIMKAAKTAIISSWKTVETTKNNINLESVVIYNKNLLKKTAPATLTGFFIVISLTGCSINPNADIEKKPQETVRVEYIAKPGDNLWDIARLYSTDAKNEKDRICELNNIKDTDNVNIGQKFILEVPVTSEYFAEEIKEYKEIEWNAKQYYVIESFIIPESEVNPTNKGFEADKETAYDLVAKANLARESLAQLEELNIEDQIEGTRTNIDKLYNDAVGITEKATQKEFNLQKTIEDYNYHYNKLGEGNIKK